MSGGLCLTELPALYQSAIVKKNGGVKDGSADLPILIILGQETDKSSIVKTPFLDGFNFHVKRHWGHRTGLTVARYLMELELQLPFLGPAVCQVTLM